MMKLISKLYKIFKRHIDSELINFQSIRTEYEIQKESRKS